MSPIVLPVDPDLLRPFAFYSALLLAKMVPLPFLIARERSTKGVYENAEDPAFNGLKGKPGKKDEVVERIRRVHRNDMENIFLFLANAAIFVLTQPEVGFAVNLIRTFAAARFLHTFVYLYEIPQPSRALAFGVGMLVQTYMAYASFSYYWSS